MKRARHQPDSILNQPSGPQTLRDIKDQGRPTLENQMIDKKKAGKKTKQAKVAAKAQSAVGTTQHRPPLEYRVVSAQDINTFQNDVNTMLEAGEWYLAGGISVMTVAKVGSLYSQALYRY